MMCTAVPLHCPLVSWHKEGAFVAVWLPVPQSVSLSNQERECGPSSLDETRPLALDVLVPVDLNWPKMIITRGFQVDSSISQA